MGRKKKPKKKRVAFLKNRKKRVRRNDLTRQIESPEEFADELPQVERVSGKGELTRHRTVIVEEDGESLRLDVDQTACRAGRVLSVVGRQCLVQDDESGEHVECVIRQVLRSMARDTRNVVVAGDRVLYRPQRDGTGIIERVEPRESTISRGSHGRAHVLVANVDQVLVVVSAADPPLKPGLIDRFLVAAGQAHVRAVIVINKVDLVGVETLQPLAGIYGGLGYTVVLCSATTGFGIDALRAVLRNKHSVVAGQSGVGKSSLLNAVQPDFQLRTGPVSNWNRKGRHTTRRAVLLPLEIGGWVADTPGIRQWELWGIEPGEVEAHFIEFRPFVPYCHFPDCTHTHETECAVKEAVAAGLITAQRYHSYCRILQDFAESA